MTLSAEQMNLRLKTLLDDGYQFLSSGQIQNAVDCCREALRIKPELVPAHFLLGLIALEAKDRDTAFRAFASVTKLQSDHAAAWAHLAKLFMADGQINRADAALAEAIKGDTSVAVVQDLLGSIYSAMGEYDLAHQWFKKANDSQRDYPPYMLNLANNQIYHGKTDDALTVLDRIISLQPSSPQAHWSLSGARKALNDEHIEAMQTLLQATSNPKVQAFYWYAVGKEYEDLERWAPAFEAFSAGAKARRQTVEYDEAAEIDMFHYLEENFTREWKDSGVDGEPTSAPIFVLGQPRSGTTLVERIICSHSQVHSAGELQQFGLAIRRLSQYRDPRRFSKDFFKAAKTVSAQQLGALYMSSTKRMQGSTSRFVDKLPQNYLLIPLILKALPNAKIVHLTRDPLDACFSSFKQLFADAYLHSYDLKEMARHHCRYRHLMEIWRQRYPNQIFDISYENTVGNLEGNARQLIAYLELPWEDACLHFHKLPSAVSTASAVQVREPVHSRSIDRWRRYETQLEPLRTELLKNGLVV